MPPWPLPTAQAPSILFVSVEGMTIISVLVLSIAAPAAKSTSFDESDPFRLSVHPYSSPYGTIPEAIDWILV